MLGHLFNVINDIFINKTVEENKKTAKNTKDEKTNSKNKLEETTVRKDNRNNISNNGSDDLAVNAFYASTILNSTNNKNKSLNEKESANDNKNLSNDNLSQSFSSSNIGQKSYHYSHSDNNDSNDGGDGGGGD